MTPTPEKPPVERALDLIRETDPDFALTLPRSAPLAGAAIDLIHALDRYLAATVQIHSRLNDRARQITTGTYPAAAVIGSLGSETDTAAELLAHAKTAYGHALAHWQKHRHAAALPPLTDSGSPLQMLHYLMDCGFTPRDEGDLFELAGVDSVIRVTWDGGEDIQVTALTPRRAILYTAAFSHDAPHAVITAAIDAAISWALPAGA